MGTPSRKMTMPELAEWHYRDGNKSAERYVSTVKARLQAALDNIAHAEKQSAEAIDSDESMTYNMSNTAHLVRTAHQELDRVSQSGTGINMAYESFLSSWTVVELGENFDDQ